ncbi:hypothetical protein PHLGIDRAFT_417801 [Phlebiopsis gigantea 11061_1 CR5-6]|uniref:Uncharacterized protein n=1 Tax=Phlebiopsis gigantea (strain 11061_1 CR5-6) TaxID=745531 RepID=A0A0C3SDI7_PHLG1|nr:hypothetical protein PHLGIDRAFT_417801 [Phlebiopsis gigantea 11061_1 CR5-6]
MVKELEQQMYERLKTELALLQAHRSDLLRQIEEVDSLVRQNTAERAKFAHINKIPDDVLKLILENAYQHPTSPDPSSPEHCYMPTALTATHVCRRWRRIAASLPALWHCVHADLHENIIALHISRSCNLPLQLEANAISGSVTQFADLLLKSAHRYKSALFWSSTVLSSAHVAGALDGIELQLLEFISVIDIEASLVDSTIKLASVSPNLRALVLYGKFDMQNFPSLPNLKTLCIVSRRGITNKQLAQLSAATP